MASEDLERLRQLREQGLLTEELYLAALRGLGVEPEPRFDLRHGQADQQVIVAGNYVDQRKGDAEGRPPDVSLRDAYLRRVIARTQGLSLVGVDPKAADDDGGCSVELAEVYMALMTQQSRGPMPTGQEARREGREPEYLSALEVLNQEPRLVVLGGPGSGKSTFVNFVALCLAGEVLGDVPADLELLTTPLPDDRDEWRLPRAEKADPQPQPWDWGPLLPVRVVLRDFVARGLPGSR